MHANTGRGETMRRNTLAMAILGILVVILLLSCGGGSSNSGSENAVGTGSCLNITNPTYHINYFETCGNANQPVSAADYQSVAIWFEVDSTNSDTGKVWIDDLYLERSDFPGVNLINNPSFESGLWPAKNNALCLAADTFCRNIIESNDLFVWSIDQAVYYSGSQSVVADMSKLGLGYQTHIFQLVPFDGGIRSGVVFKAHAMIKIEGNVQVRLGIDFRGTSIDPANPRASIFSAVNGLVIRGTTNGWRRIDLR